MSLFGRGQRNTGSTAGRTRQPAQGANTANKTAAGPKIVISRIRIDSGFYSVVALDTKRVAIAGLDRDFIKGQRIHFAFVLEVDGENVEIPTSGLVLQTKDDKLTASYMAPQPYYQRYLKHAANAHPNPAKR